MFLGNPEPFYLTALLPGTRFMLTEFLPLATGYSALFSLYVHTQFPDPSMAMYGTFRRRETYIQVL
jgi:hypothetical protein